MDCKFFVINVLTFKRQDGVLSEISILGFKADRLPGGYKRATSSSRWKASSLGRSA
jgi:hypothetical protein